MLKKISYPDRETWSGLVARPVLQFETIEEQIKSVFNQVRKTGDAALLELTARFDNVQLASLTVTEEELNAAANLVSQDLQNAIRQAYVNIKTFHEAQQERIKVIETMPGVTCWRKSVALGKVGLYIPGGTAPLFSTLLMLGIPAKLAGCQEIVLCTPPAKDGSIHPAILFTASLLGISTIRKVGGSQAIAAFTFGTESVPKVYKIFGPGNQYVTVAKQMAGKYGVAIDMPAGPSEVLVLADETAIPAFVAADLLSQAEHGIDSQVVLVTNSENLLEQVNQEIKAQLQNLSRQAIAA